MGCTSSELSVSTVAKATANLAATVKLQELVGTSRPNHMVLICSFEALYTHGRALCTGAGVDVLVADEAHVLASDGARAKVVRSVPAGARLLLTGTPLSNNLMELYTLYDLARPGVLGREAHFRADFVSPIRASSEVGACPATRAVGGVASAQLAAVAKGMQLGRKGGEVERDLPPRHDLLIMCRPTGLQRQLVALCNPLSTDGALMTKGAALVCLAAINTALLDPAELTSSKFGSAKLYQIVAKLPERAAEQMALSGKLQACARLLDHIRAESMDKIVVVASRLAVLRRIRQYVVDTFDGGEASVWMLHGDVPIEKRKERIDQFNGGAGGLRVCLLISNLAVGINLVGANHVILLAPAYNPAVDKQAAARCHRGGQLKPCYVYRLLATGSIDETIVMRQLRKGGLCDILVDGKLPPLHSPDCDLLFKLDEPACVSRLHTTSPRDSPYVDESVWGVGEAAGDTETWLPLLMKEALLEPPCYMTDASIEGCRAVQCTANPNVDGATLVSFVLRSTCGTRES